MNYFSERIVRANKSKFMGKRIIAVYSTLVFIPLAGFSAPISRGSATAVLSASDVRNTGELVEAFNA